MENVEGVMSYLEARRYIDGTAVYGSVLGLESIIELLRRLGDPQDKLKFIHIAGTNGKGSTSAFLSSILIEAGYRVGRYVSPTIMDYRECIQIGYKNALEQLVFIKEEAVAKHIQRIQRVSKEMQEAGYAHPTQFEVETAMAFLEFASRDCDMVVLEVGLGGRLDATNVIKNIECAVLTDISMDHMHILGDTLEQIAFEKAGIIKPGCLVVSSEQDEKVTAVIRQVCEQKEATYRVVDNNNIENTKYSLDNNTFEYKGEGPYNIRLLGSHQIKNAVLALEVIFALIQKGYLITQKDVKTGLEGTRHFGRLEILRTSPYLIVDGAHNEAAARALRDSLEIYFKNRRCIFIMGVLADKEYESILKRTADFADTIITITPDNQRALDSRKLAQVAKQYCRQIFDAQTIDRALTIAHELAEKDDVILCFGSLSYLGEVYRLLNENSRI